jgi:hypothetical protein
MDPNQVTNLLSQAHTCLWEWESSLLFCRGFRLFPDRLLGVGNRWRSNHHTETGSVVLRAWSPSLDGDLDPLTGVERVGLICTRSIDEACIFQGTQLGTLIRKSSFLRDGTA